MDVYKLRPADVGGKPIDKAAFEADTHKQPPWYRKGAGERGSQFAVCPACDNPIQLIGLYELPANASRAFGKHTVSSVDDLADVDSEARDNCPYFKPRKYDKSARKTRFEGTPRKILQVLIEQFDRVIYQLEKDTGVTWSRKALQGMLTRYRGERGHMYQGATLRNVPWIFAYMSDATDLFAQKLSAELQSVVRDRVPNADISAEGRVVNKVLPDGSKAPFFDLKHAFIHHHVKKNGEDGALVETMKMVLSLREGWKPAMIHEQIIEFDYESFEHLIKIPDDKGKRRPDLVELARSELSHLLD